MVVVKFVLVIETCWLRAFQMDQAISKACWISNVGWGFKYRSNPWGEWTFQLIWEIQEEKDQTKRYMSNL